MERGGGGGGEHSTFQVVSEEPNGHICTFHVPLSNIYSTDTKPLSASQGAGGGGGGRGGGGLDYVCDAGYKIIIHSKFKTRFSSPNHSPLLFCRSSNIAFHIVRPKNADSCMTHENTFYTTLTKDVNFLWA